MIIEVSASGCLPHLPFDAIGTLGLYDAECTLELQLQPYWMTLGLIVGGGPGDENHAQLRFGMWLVEFPDQGYHAFLRPILTGWLARLLGFCNVFSDYFVVDDPFTLYYFRVVEFAVNMFKFRSHYCSLVSPSLVCLNIFGFVFTEFGVLEFFWNC